MNDKIVITIGRQYGSGGRTIGQMLSERLGIHYYDKELLKLASEDSGINEALFAGADEKLKNTRLFKIAHSVYHGELIPPESDDFVSTQPRSSNAWQKRSPVSLSDAALTLY